MDHGIHSLFERLNHELHKTCEKLSFTYTRRRDNSVKISILYNAIDASYIQLDPPKEGEIVLEFSRTSTPFQKKNLNKCLRYLAAMIASMQKCYLVSNAINWVSLYTMSSIFEEDCEIKTPIGEFEPRRLSIQECKDLVRDAPDHSVTSRVNTSDYDKFERKLFEAIPTLRCKDLGGTRKHKRRKLYSRKYAYSK